MTLMSEKATYQTPRPPYHTVCSVLINIFEDFFSRPASKSNLRASLLDLLQRKFGVFDTLGDNTLPAHIKAGDVSFDRSTEERNAVQYLLVLDGLSYPRITDGGSPIHEDDLSGLRGG